MAFSMFDRDGSGTVDVEEMRAVCKQVGIIPTDSELQLMIQELDTDQSGDIDKEEFLACLESKQVDPESEDVIKFAFERFDTDGSGACRSIRWKSFCDAHAQGNCLMQNWRMF